LLADNTGGRFFLADGLSGLKQRFASIAAELRQQYSLSFYPTNRSVGANKRELKVKVDAPNVTVKARRNYLYSPPIKSA